MKTNFSIRNQAKHHLNICAVFFPLLLLALQVPNTAHGQKLHAGASLSALVSGNGFGASQVPQLVLNTRRHSLALGVNFQHRHNNLSGLRGNYSYIIVDPQDPVELFVFYDAAYHHAALLGKQTLAMEGQISPELTSDFSTAKISATEHHIGFGMNFYILRSLKVFWGAGAGYYYTSKSSNHGLAFKYRERSNFSVILTGGIKMNLVRIK